MKTGDVRKHPDFAAAWQQAERELHLPCRGLTSSPENKERQRMGPIVFARAKEILERGELIRHD